MQIDILCSQSERREFIKRRQR